MPMNPSHNSLLREEDIMATKRSGGLPAYEPPSSASGPDPAAASSEYEPPSEAAMDSAQAEAETFLAGVDSQLLAAKSAVEDLLQSLATEAEGVTSAASMDSNIVGVGIGLGELANHGGPPGEPVLEIYTIEREAHEETRARIASAAGFQALSA